MKREVHVYSESRVQDTINFRIFLAKTELG